MKKKFLNLNLTKVLPRVNIARNIENKKNRFLKIKTNSKRKKYQSYFLKNIGLQHM
ncbi:Uncharacterised protein [Sphingobacterium daejeonense]|nr:Uncharacterised protein [Sphingobacterium daejeonense]